MKLQKTIALGAGVCALALTAVATPAHAATTTQTTTQNTTTGVFTPSTQTVKINYNANFGIAVWTNPNGSITGKYVPGQTTVKVAGSQVVNGKTWYLLADNSGWIDGQYVTTNTNSNSNSSTATNKPTSSAKVTSINETVTVGSNGAAIYSNTNASAKTSRVLNKGSQWRAFSRIEDENNVWYNLGGNQYVLSSALTTQNQTPASAKATTKSINSIVKITNAKGAYIYSDTHASAKTSRVLKNGSQWKAFKTADNGLLWLNLGGNQWILASDTNYSANSSTTTNSQPSKTNTSTSVTSSTGTLTINYKPGYGIAVWSQPGKNLIKGKYLKHGTSWKYFATTNVNGHTWYNVGGNQWIDGAYTTATPDKTTSNNTSNITNLAYSFATINYKPGYSLGSFDAPYGKSTDEYFKDNTLVNVLAVTKDHKWSKITDVVTDQTGWVPTQYLKAQYINN